MSIATVYAPQALAARYMPRVVPFPGKAAQPVDPLRNLGTKRVFARGEMVFNEGDAATYIYKIISGAVRLCRHRVNGRRQIADFRLAGDFLGVAQRSEYGVTGEAVSDTVVIMYPRRQVEQLCDEEPECRNLLINLLTEQLALSHDHLVMLGRQTAKERLVAFLLMLTKRAKAQDGDTIALPMSRQDIADYLGLTIETVCRVLTSLKKSRLIATPTLHDVVLQNLEALEELAEGDDTEGF